MLQFVLILCYIRVCLSANHIHFKAFYLIFDLIATSYFNLDSNLGFVQIYFKFNKFFIWFSSSLTQVWDLAIFEQHPIIIHTLGVASIVLGKLIHLKDTHRWYLGMPQSYVCQLTCLKSCAYAFKCTCKYQFMFQF